MKLFHGPHEDERQSRLVELLGEGVGGLGEGEEGVVPAAHIRAVGRGGLVEGRAG